MKAESSNKSLANTVALLGILGTIGIVSALSAFTPSALAAETSGSVKLSAGVTAAISMSITGNADGTDCTNEGFNSCSTFGNLLPNQYATTSSLISVYTNSSDGYSLSVKADNHADLQTESGSSIPAGTLTSETGGQGIWSYKTDGTGIKTNWTPMTTTDTTIKGTSIYSATDSDTTVTYGLSTSNNQAAGDYSTTLIYTATAPNDTEVFEPNPTANFSGDHATFSAASVPITSGGTGTVTITPAEGYYLSSFTCTNGYTNNATTGSSATSAQAVTITNPNVAKSSTCTASMSQVKDITHLTSMQDLANHPEYCANTAEHVSTTIKDERDNQQYTIFKAKDGNCWMGENLRYGINPDGTAHPFVASDAALSDNVDSTKMLDLTYDATNPNTAGRIKNGENGMRTADNSTNAFSDYGDNYTEPYIDIYGANDASPYDGQTKFGVIYNYCAVTGGTACTDDNTDYNPTGSVCPKGWKLPGMTASATGTGAVTDGSIKTYNNLFDAYGVTSDVAGFNKITPSPLAFVRPGVVTGNDWSNGSSLNFRFTSTKRGEYWSSTKVNDYSWGAFRLYINDGGGGYVMQTDSSRAFGFSARCVSE